MGIAYYFAAVVAVTPSFVDPACPLLQLQPQLVVVVVVGRAALLDFVVPSASGVQCRLSLVLQCFGPRSPLRRS